MSGESQIILTMFSGTVLLVIFFFRHICGQISKLEMENKDTRKAVVEQANVLAAVVEINKKMEQWYAKNIPELHDDVKKINREMANSRTSIARLKILTGVDADKILSGSVEAHKNTA